MLKRRNRVYRRIAVALTVALLAGQSQALVLAEEGDAPQTEIAGETGTNTSDSGNDTGGGSTDSGNTENNGMDDQPRGITRAAETDRISASAGRSARRTL